MKMFASAFDSIALRARIFVKVPLSLGAFAITFTFATAFGEDSIAWTPTEMMKVKRIGSVQVSPDGERVAFVVREAVMEGKVSEFRAHVHLAEADRSDRRQLTRGEHSCDDPQWSPDGKRLAFISNRKGKKNIWLIRPDGGEAEPLTKLKGDVVGYRWSPDGRSIALAAFDPPTEADEKRERMKDDAIVVDERITPVRLYLVRLEAKEKPRVLSPTDRSVVNEANRAGRAGFDWSPDGRTIVFAHAATPRPDDWQSADVATVDIATATVKQLSTSAAAEGSPLYSPDGKTIAFTVSDQPATWAGARRIHVVASAGGTSRELADTHDGFGRYSELVGWSANGDKIYFTELQGTSLALCALPLSGKAEMIDHREGMSFGGFHLNFRRTHIGFSWEVCDRPVEAYCSSLERFEPIKVSEAQSRELKLKDLGRTEVLKWKSADGLEVEGLLTYPHGYREGVRYPLLLIIHGGPMGAFTQSFDGAPTQYPVATFADAGYVVLRPNPRGSSGYGKKFRYANYGDWGGGDFRDLMAGVDHAIELGVADPKRLGVMGWSYGGYMTSWTITQTKRFRAASVGAGVTNLMSFTGTADIPSFLPDYFGGEYWSDPAPYRARSAMFQVKGVDTPTLIQHGEHDERVPLSQGQELYNALKRQECDTKMIVYPRTPHGIEEPRLLLDCMNRNVDWFAKYVLQAKR